MPDFVNAAYFSWFLRKYGLGMKKSVASIKERQRSIKKLAPNAQFRHRPRFLHK